MSDASIAQAILEAHELGVAAGEKRECAAVAALLLRVADENEKYALSDGWCRNRYLAENLRLIAGILSYGYHRRKEET